MFTHFEDRCQSLPTEASSTTPTNTRLSLSPGGITFTVTRRGGSPIAAISTVLMGSASYETCISYLANRY